METRVDQLEGGGIGCMDLADELDWLNEEDEDKVV